MGQPPSHPAAYCCDKQDGHVGQGRPADAAARLQALVATRATVLVKGMLIQNDASSLALDMYAPVSIYAAN